MALSTRDFESNTCFTIKDERIRCHRAILVCTDETEWPVCLRCVSIIALHARFRKCIDELFSFVVALHRLELYHRVHF